MDTFFNVICYRENRVVFEIVCSYKGLRVKIIFYIINVFFQYLDVIQTVQMKNKSVVLGIQKKMHENITKLIDHERIPVMIPVVLLRVMAEIIGGTFFIQDAQVLCLSMRLNKYYAIYKAMNNIAFCTT